MFYPAPATARIHPSGVVVTPEEAEIQRRLALEQAELNKLADRAQVIETTLAIIAAFSTAFGVGEAIGKAFGIRRRRRMAELAARVSQRQQNRSGSGSETP